MTETTHQLFGSNGSFVTGDAVGFLVMNIAIMSFDPRPYYAIGTRRNNSFQSFPEIAVDSLGIDESKLEFQPMPERVRPISEPVIQDAEAEPMMTIAEAKVRLARTFHVNPETIEITVRG